MTAVIADDSKTQRDVAISCMKELGIEVVAVCVDGREAWRVIQELRPDLAVLDYIMPHMTGGEISEAIHTEDLPTRVILATSMGQKAAAYAVNADAIVIKPFTTPVLALKISQAFHGVH